MCFQQWCKKKKESQFVRFVQQAMVQVLHSKMTRWIQRRRTPESSVSGSSRCRFSYLRNKVSTKRTRPSRQQPSTLRYGHDMQVYAVLQHCSSELRHTRDIHECFPQIDSVRHSSSIRSVSAVPGLHQHSPASHVHPRSVLQRSPLVPLRNPGFQEPVATVRQQACQKALGFPSLSLFQRSSPHTMRGAYVGF